VVFPEDIEPVFELEVELLDDDLPLPDDPLAPPPPLPPAPPPLRLNNRLEDMKGTNMTER